jgi:hypothetical protein
MINLSRSSDSDSLIQASTNLLTESSNILQNINLEDLSNKEVLSFGRNIIKKIDRITDFVLTLSGINNKNIILVVVQLKDTLDESFIVLSDIYSELQRRLLLGEFEPAELISYSSFLSEVSIKLLEKSIERLPQAESSNINLIFE